MKRKFDVAAALATLTDQQRKTLLFRAIGTNKDAAVVALISAGADVNVVGKGGLTPLHVATKVGSKQAAELLLANGATCDAQDRDGNTPLHVAADGGYADIVRLLLSHGARPNIANANRDIALHYAAN